MKRSFVLLLFLLSSCDSLPTVGIYDAYKISLEQPKKAIEARYGFPSRSRSLDVGNRWGIFRIPTKGYSLVEYYFTWGGRVVYINRFMYPIPPRTCRVIFLFDPEKIARSFSFRGCPPKVMKPKPYPTLPPDLRFQERPEIPPYVPDGRFPKG